MVEGRNIPVLLDSNILMTLVQFKVDIFEQIRGLVEGRVEFVVLKPVYEELKRIAEEGKPKARMQASLALKLCRERCKIVNLELGEGESVDDFMLRVSKEWKCPVATNDRELRRRLRKAGGPVIYLRQKSFLEMEGAIVDV